MSRQALVTLEVQNVLEYLGPLRVAAQPVTDWRCVEPIVETMRTVLDGIEYGAGLSAVQIGASARLAIVNIERRAATELVLVNPRLVSVSGRLTVRREGCLSLPGYAARVRRRDKVVVEASDLRGVRYVHHARGYEAAVIQHELDHLDGILYWDRLECGVSLQPIDEVRL